MKTSKRPVFKLNTSELPKDYKQPIKPKKRKGHRGPRRIVRSRRRNEFIPENTDWCEINGQKLRQDIFFGEKRGRKFIPDGPLNFFVSSVPEGAGTELLEAPYGDGGDGGSCGCACEGCVCDSGEGCSCSGPGTGTDSDTGFGQGAQDGSQGQQGGYDDTGVGSPGGPEGLGGGYQGGYDDTGVGAPGGPSGFDTGYQGGYDNTGIGSPGGPSGFDTGYQGGYDDTGVGSPGGPAGLGEGYQGGFDDTGVGAPGGPAGFDAGYQGGFDNTGVGSPGGPAGLSAQRGMDMEFNPFSEPLAPLNENPFVDPKSVMDPAWSLAPDGQTSAAGAPGGRGFSNPFANQDLVADPLDRESVMDIDPKGINLQEINVAPPAQLDPIGIPGITAQELGRQAEALTARGVLDPIDPSLYQGPFAPQSPDAKGIDRGTLLDMIDQVSKGVQEQTSPGFGFIGKAGAQELGPTSQFGPLTSSLFGPAYTANPLAENPFSNPLSMGIQSTFTAAPTVGPNPTGFSVDPEAQTSKGPLSVDPEAPGRTMESPHTVMTDPGRTMSEPHTVAPYTITNPFADMPTTPEEVEQIGREMLTEQLQAQPYGPQMPAAINPEYAPTPEQVQAARDYMTQQLTPEEPHVNPLERGPEEVNPDPFGRENPLQHVNPLERGPEEVNPLQHVNPLERGPEEVNLDPFDLDLREQEDRAAHVNPLDRSQQEVMARDVDLGREHVNPLAPFTTRDQPPPPPPTQITVSPTQFAPGRSGLSGRGAQTGRGAGSLGRGTDRGTGRDSPGVQGLPAGLRGNDLAQALVSRGFDPNLVGAALTVSDRGAMLTAMLEAAGLSHAQAMAVAAAARSEVAAEHGIPSGNVNASGVARGR